jgi:hypothetical protein
MSVLWPTYQRKTLADLTPPSTLHSRAAQGQKYIQQRVFASGHLSVRCLTRAVRTGSLVVSWPATIKYNKMRVSRDPVFGLSLAGVCFEQKDR